MRLVWNFLCWILCRHVYRILSGILAVQSCWYCCAKVVHLSPNSTWLVTSRHIRRVEPMHFGCVELVEQHVSTRSSWRAWLARHVKRVELCGDVMWQAKWNLGFVATQSKAVIAWVWQTKKGRLVSLQVFAGDAGIQFVRRCSGYKVGVFLPGECKSTDTSGLDYALWADQRRSVCGILFCFWLFFTSSFALIYVSAHMHTRFQ